MKIKDQKTDEEIEMHAVYFDTEDRRLYREGIAFRVRKEGNRLVATLKWNGSSEDGMHKREEINIPVDDEKKLHTPDIRIFDQSEMLSIDQGEIVCCGRTAPISELEIELYSGDEADMTELGQTIAEKYQLRTEDTSKYKRGLDLMK